MGRVRLNPAGIREFARGEKLKAEIHRKAEEIAANVRDQGIQVGGFKGHPGEMDLPVDVRDKVTDRAHSVVTIKHPAGLAVQAKHGALTKAASAAGLQVRGG